MYDLLIVTSHCELLGIFFYSCGNRYEGEWKEGNKHGQGMNKIAIVWFIDSNITLHIVR